MTDALRIIGATKAFGATVAVDGVDLDVADGELLALVGPSGCGKSTLLRLVAGLMGLDAGTIAIGGRVVDDGVRRIEPEERRVGLVFQEHALFPHLTVAENVTFGLRALPKSEQQRRCREWLDVVGLGDHGGRYPHELSGGERQRIALARALAPQPSLVLLDEPFASLDTNLRAQIRRDVVATLRAAGTPALFVTHDQQEALAVGDRVAVMCKGRILQVDSPESVYLRPRSRFVAEFMGETNILTLDADTAELGLASAPDGAQVAVRPDDVIVHVDDAEVGVKAVVLSAEYRGSVWSYTLQLPSGVVLRSTQPHGMRLPVGSVVHVSVKPGQHPALADP